MRSRDSTWSYIERLLKSTELALRILAVIFAGVLWTLNVLDKSPVPEKQIKVVVLEVKNDLSSEG